MKEFEPRPYQKEVVEHLAKKPLVLDTFRLRQLTGSLVYGVDLAQESGDKNTIVYGKPDGKGGFKVLYIDEYSEMPDYKWYRNPIKWWKWHRMWKTIEKQAWKTKVWTNSNNS